MAIETIVPGSVQASAAPQGRAELPAALATLKAGETVDAVALARLDSGEMRLALLGTLLDILPVEPLQPGEPIKLTVVENDRRLMVSVRRQPSPAEPRALPSQPPALPANGLSRPPSPEIAAPLLVAQIASIAQPLQPRPPAAPVQPAVDMAGPMPVPETAGGAAVPAVRPPPRASQSPAASGIPASVRQGAALVPVAEPPAMPASAQLVAVAPRPPSAPDSPGAAVTRVAAARGTIAAMADPLPFAPPLLSPAAGAPVPPLPTPIDAAASGTMQPVAPEAMVAGDTPRTADAPAGRATPPAAGSQTSAAPLPSAAGMEPIDGSRFAAAAGSEPTPTQRADPRGDGAPAPPAQARSERGPHIASALAVLAGRGGEQLPAPVRQTLAALIAAAIDPMHLIAPTPDTAVERPAPTPTGAGLPRSEGEAGGAAQRPVRSSPNPQGPTGTTAALPSRPWPQDVATALRDLPPAGHGSAAVGPPSPLPSSPVAPSMRDVVAALLLLIVLPEGRDAARRPADGDPGLPVRPDRPVAAPGQPPQHRDGAPTPRPAAAVTSTPDTSPAPVARPVAGADGMPEQARQPPPAVAPEARAPADLPPRHDRLAEIPLSLPGGQAPIVSLAIGRDGRGSPAGGAPAWSMRLSLDLDGTGPMQALISLRGERAGVTLWAERPETADLFRRSIGELHDALAVADLDVGLLEVRSGAPAAPEVPAGSVLDRRS